jgi:glycosyltransferase involved in cell wall biosynthesis
MKIAVLLTFDQSLVNWKVNGHLDREIFYYKELYKKYKIKTTFISYGPDSENNLISKYKYLNVISVGSKLGFKKSFFYRFVISFFLFFFIKKDLKNINIIRTNQLWGSWVLLLFKFLSKKKILIRCGYEPNQNLELEKGFTSHKLFYFIFSFISYRLSNHIIVTTLDIKKYIKKKFKLIKKISVIPNFINIKNFRSYNIKKIENKILFIGRNSKEKNLSFLLNSIKELDIQLDILGPGYNLSQIQFLSKKYKIKINYLGILPNYRMPKVYNKYNIYVSTSDYEGNPKTILEAMACGCIVIARNTQGSNSIILNRNNGYLVNNILQLRKLITKNIIKKNNKIKINAINYIKKNHSIDVVSSKEFTILKNLYNE